LYISRISYGQYNVMITAIDLIVNNL